MTVGTWTTDSHLDYFARNILAGVDVDASTAVQVFRSNAPGVPWPDGDKLLEWAESEGYGPETINTSALTIALAAATSRIAERCELLVRPVNDTGQVDESLTPVLVPPEIHLAVLIQAHRWMRRTDTPEGMFGASEFTGVVRASRLDPDVEALIANYVVYGLA